MARRGRSSGRPPGSEGRGPGTRILGGTGEYKDAPQKPLASDVQAPISPSGKGKQQDNEIKSEPGDDEPVLDVDDDDLLEVDLHKELEKGLLIKPPFKMPILKDQNYYVWALTHKRFFEGRGVFGIVYGTKKRPLTRQAARRWVQVDRWIASMLIGNADDTQKTYVAGLTRSKDIWDTFNRVHGANGKGRLMATLQKFNGYVKSEDQTIDQMAADLCRLKEEIRNLEPTAVPNDIITAATIMNACQGTEYETAKYVLSMNDHLTAELAVKHLRSCESRLKAVQWTPRHQKE